MSKRFSSSLVRKIYRESFKLVEHVFDLETISSWLGSPFKGTTIIKSGIITSEPVKYFKNTDTASLESDVTQSITKFETLLSCTLYEGLFENSTTTHFETSLLEGFKFS